RDRQKRRSHRRRRGAFAWRGARHRGADRARLARTHPWLALDDAERGELYDTSGEPGALDDLDNPLDLLVGERSLLGEPLVRRRADHDPLRLELAAQVGALDLFPGTGAGERAAGAVT